jgi:hypothetical protein
VASVTTKETQLRRSRWPVVMMFEVELEESSLKLFELQVQ